MKEFYGSKIEREVAGRFPRAVREHQIDVRLDIGMHRHLVFKAPTTGIEWIEIVTWPGSLYVGGDRDGHVFSRLPDMFEFFRGSGGQVNPSYWSEKLVAPTPGHGRANVKTFSEERFKTEVRDYLGQAIQEWPRGTRTALREAVRKEVLIEGSDGEYEAQQAVEGFEFPPFWERKHGDPVFKFPSPYEGAWDFNDWDCHFLWQLHAIVWGIAYYDAHKAGRKIARARAPRSKGAS